MTWLAIRERKLIELNVETMGVWTNEFSELCFPGFQFHFALLADNEFKMKFEA